MKEKELKLLSEALASENPEEKVCIACRKILSVRIDNMPANDPNVRPLLSRLVQCMDFSVKKVLQTEDVYYTDNTKSNGRKKLLFGLLGLGGVVLTIVEKPVIIPILGGVITFFFATKLGQSLVVPKAMPMTKYRLIIKTTADDLLHKMDDLCELFTPVLSLNQLEGRYINFLSWMQRSYSTSSDEKLCKSIAELLQYYDFELKSYEPGLVNFFEPSQGNVSELTTTIYAIRNAKTGACILRGTIVIPIANN